MDVWHSPEITATMAAWKELLGMLVALILGYVAYQWYQESVYETRLHDAIVATNKLDPHWRRDDLIREYEKLPASIHFGPELLVWRGYRVKQE